MSIIDGYRATLKFLFSGDIKRIIITTMDGLGLIKNVFTQKELLDMEILGVFALGDLGVFENFKKNNHEVVFFVEGENEINEIYLSLPRCVSNVYIHFYTPISSDLANRIKMFDTNDYVRLITTSSSALIPISIHCAINSKASVLSVMKQRPKKIVTFLNQASDPLYMEANTTIDNCMKQSTLFEKDDRAFPTLLVYLDRNFDRVTPKILSWTYEAMLHRHNVKFKNHTGHCSDDFFNENAYELYENVLKNIGILANKIKTKYPEGKSRNAKETLEYEEASKMLSKHVDALNELKKIIQENDIFTKSEREQKAITRQLNSKERDEFKILDPETERVIYSTKKEDLRETSVYYQHIPKIRNIIEKYVVSNDQFKRVFIYVKGSICYEEVAEVELFNKKSNIKVYLLSDNIDNQWNYLASMSTNKTISDKPILRVITLFSDSENDAVKRESKLTKGVLDKIQDDIIKLETLSKQNFNPTAEKQAELLSAQLTVRLTKEYDKLKALEPTNQIEENDKNAKMIKLTKLTGRFKNMEYNKKKIDNNCGLKGFFDEDNDLDIEEGGGSALKLKNSYNNVMTERLIKERGHAIENISKGVQDINAMMLELKMLVEVQSLKLEEIEIHLINSNDLVKKGVEELKSADNSHASAVGIQQKITLFLGFVAAAIWVGVGVKLSGH